jgi:hypothetical protein
VLTYAIDPAALADASRVVERLRTETSKMPTSKAVHIEETGRRAEPDDHGDIEPMPGAKVHERGERGRDQEEPGERATFVR